MLTPEQLDRYPDSLVELYSKAESDIIADIARRISTYDYFIPSAQHQYNKLLEMGNVNDEILKKLSSMTGYSKTELKSLMEDAGYKAIKVDDSVYKKAGLNPLPIEQSPALMAMLETGINNTNGLFENLARTTANTGSKQFERILDRAYLQITTGAFDYNTAIRTAVKDLASNGIAAIEYPNGHINYIESAVRRAVITGVNQTALKMQDARADEMGSDLVETSAHAGARPSHARWQGKVFSRSGNSTKYPDFKLETGYGTGPGLGGWSCRHSFYPFFEGLSEPAYTKAELDDMNDKKYEYNGEKLTEYEASQKQRTIERNIRRWKREYSGMEVAGQPTNEAASKIIRWQDVQKDFLKQTGLKRQIEREQIAGFGKSEAQKTAWTQKNKVKKFAEQHVSSVENTLHKTDNSGIINNKAKYFSNRVEADEMFRPWTEEVWAELSKSEKHAAYEYTSGSGKFNRPLRGYNNDWDNYVGIGKVYLDNEGAGQMIVDLKNAIDKAEIKEDVWLFRGSDQQSLGGLLGIDKSKIIPSNISALNKKFTGKRIEDTAFFSTGVSSDAGFKDKISYEILAPKGTKGIYAEPFSHFGGTNTTGDWDGKQKAAYIKFEAEMILQSGTKFSVKELKLVSEKITVILEVIR